MAASPRLAFVGSAGRSGSTLLDLLLNNNPEVQSLGEFHRVASDAVTGNEPCTCGEEIDACPFWQAVEAEGRRRRGDGEREPLLHRLDPMLRPGDLGRASNAVHRLSLLVGWPALHARVERAVAPTHWQAVRNSLFWYDVVRAVSHASVIVDSTKDVRRLKSLYLAEPEGFRLIYLVRDGRAVCASGMRRTGETMAEAALGWKQLNERLQWTAATIPGSRKMRVRYEDLCSDPEAVLERVCALLGVAFSRDMLVLNKNAAHNIGGNPMRFRRGELKIALDERWRSQLGSEDLQTFERIAGPMNRRLGYV